MLRRFTLPAASLLGLLSACGKPADGALFIVAEKVNLFGLDEVEQISANARDLTGIEDLEELLGIQGVPVIEDGNCKVFLDDATVVAFPGEPVDGGPILVSGASAFGQDITLSFDPDDQEYQTVAGNLFIGGDELVFSGAGFNILSGFEATLTFPTDIAIQGGDITIVRGQDATITWNAVNDPAEQVVIFIQTFQGLNVQTQLLCEARDNGSFTIPGNITAGLSAGAEELIGLFRVNGFPFISAAFNNNAIQTSDFDLFVKSMNRGEENFFAAVNGVFSGDIDVVEP